MEMRARAIAWIAALLVGGVFVTPATGEPVRVDFYLNLTSTFGDMAALHGSPLGPGDRIRGSLVYDPFAPPLRVDELHAQYAPAGSITLGFGSGVVIPLEGMVVAEPRIINGIPQPSFVVAFGYTYDFPGFDSVQAELDFRGVRPGVALPQSAAELLTAYPAGFLRGSALQTGVEPPWDRGTQEFFGTVTPVPEPGTLLLAASGAALLLRKRTRTRT